MERIVSDDHIIMSSKNVLLLFPFPTFPKKRERVDEISLPPLPSPPYHNLRWVLAALSIFHGSECRINWRHQSLVRLGV